MPKPAAHALHWSPENQCYFLHTLNQPPLPLFPEDKGAWRAWLATHASFSFQGQHGHLNALKEVRSRGNGYWYAYHTHSGQTRKRYLGTDATVTLVLLEEMAQDLLEGQQKPSLFPSGVLEARPVSLHFFPAGNETPSRLVEPGDSFDDPGMLMVLTRLVPPPLPAALVGRERLLLALETALSCPLTLLSASAGWGKTTLLSAWAQRHQGAVAWLSLEPLDNDPTRFWISVIAALRTCWPEMGTRALALLHTSAPLSTSLTTLLNEFAGQHAEGSPLVLILDDYHVIDEPSIHASLTFWLEHVPPHVHLVVGSRVDPDLPLSRLRVRGHLVEIRDTDLRFTREETQRFLTQRMGLALSEADVTLLEARTEGWIASLQLAALFLQKQTDPSASVHMLSDSQRFVLDYLREEILTNLPEDLQDFLLQTSWLNPLSASLCDAIRGREDSAHLLEQVERANLFLQPLSESRQWYRYHALWAQAMQHEAQLRLGTATLRSLKSKASQWYEQQRMFPEAIETALACEEFSRAAVLIGRFLVPHSFHNEYHLLCSWLKRMPEKPLQAQPDLCLQYVLALTFTTDRRSPGTWEQVERLLQWAKQGFEATQQWEQLGEALQLHAELAFFQDDQARALALIRQARSLLSEQSLMYLDNVVMSGFEAFLAGEMEVAYQHLLEGYWGLKNLGNLSAAFATSLMLGEVCLEKGELHRASHYYHQALAHMDEDQEIARQQLLLSTGSTEPFFVSWAYHNLAQLSYERNELSDAQRHLSGAQTLRATPEKGIHVLASGALVQARLLHACGETARAQEVLVRWERNARFSWPLSAIRVWRARLQLADGDLSAVEQWAQEKQQADQSQASEQEEALPLLLQQEEALLQARLYIAQQKGETALKALVPWKEKAQAQGRRRSMLEIQILCSLAHVVSQELAQAKSSLREALQLAQPGNFQRLFLDEGATMEALLRMLLPELREAPLISHARTLLSAFAQESGAQPTEEAAPLRKDALLLGPLSEQEQRVLRLLVAGRSNPEIANALVISLNTVKTHVQSLYRKLDVHNRVEASEVARRLSLL
ncbi:LuxR family transcriptional regulator [Ktedonobacter sp. SOSP1-85]|uniref:LuxR C-terminal-related transcriptional regulator n=1 Tax=Ktedonobacter sp. SOSP1-85 TaxID=2778367 RepID=UPI0019151B78|nr:LuxR C-terminal-related transcriptional regulator [Ktedonobacter sp. SOSP1-85]GHO80951.1 LuxR family transcriptional regulator [Ktedonobacter sp. SOSP1-85]